MKKVEIHPDAVERVKKFTINQQLKHIIRFLELMR